LTQLLFTMKRFHRPEGDLEMPLSSSVSDIPTTRYNTVYIPSVDESFTDVSLPCLISPKSIYNKRIFYSILEFNPLLDSANADEKVWIKIASFIKVNYSYFDAFIILHGTDTMAYTASALSFLLENLGKTVIITGSQVPLAEVRNDAIENLLGALTIAGHFVIPEVSLYFHNVLLRGNRCTKVNAVDFHAFDSPNMRPLVKVGIDIGKV
jgi:lysophospholipase